MIEVFDAHCHVDLTPDGGAYIGAPKSEAAVVGRLLCGVSPGDWDAVETAALEGDNVVPAFGLHPWEIATAPDDWLNVLGKKLRARPNAWLGEAGLDRVRTSSASLETQRDRLIDQLNLARELQRPASLHCVRAWEDILPILDKEYLSGGPDRFVMHAFAGPPTYVRAFAERGAFFSIGSAVLKADFRRQRESVAAIPDDRLLVESDAYVYAPNDGAEELAAILAELASIRKRSPTDMAERILENSRRLFLDGR